MTVNQTFIRKQGGGFIPREQITSLEETERSSDVLRAKLRDGSLAFVLRSDVEQQFLPPNDSTETYVVVFDGEGWDLTFRPCIGWRSSNAVMVPIVAGLDPMVGEVVFASSAVPGVFYRVGDSGGYTRDELLEQIKRERARAAKCGGAK